MDVSKSGTIDLNKPPVVRYEFKKFPMLVYLPSKCEPARDEIRKTANGDEAVHVPANYHTRIVTSEEELKAALKKGWSEKAPSFAEALSSQL